jgi:hypothetical protein
MTYILVIGDPVSGLSFSGPFYSYDSAEKFIEQLSPNETCWVAELFTPEESTVPEDGYKEMSEEEAEMYCRQDELYSLDLDIDEIAGVRH